MPGNQLILSLTIDLRIPLNQSTGGTNCDPPILFFPDISYGLKVMHEPRQVFEVTPELKRALRRTVQQHAASGREWLQIGARLCSRKNQPFAGDGQDNSSR